MEEARSSLNAEKEFQLWGVWSRGTVGCPRRAKLPEEGQRLLK